MLPANPQPHAVYERCIAGIGRSGPISIDVPVPPEIYRRRPDSRGSALFRRMSAPRLAHELIPQPRDYRVSQPLRKKGLALRIPQLDVMFGVYLFAVGSFNHAQMSSGVQVQGHPGEQLPWGY